jgi:hypothetical protein
MKSSKSFLIERWNFCVGSVATVSSNVYRDANKLADRLANRAIDQALQQAG